MKRLHAVLAGAVAVLPLLGAAALAGPAGSDRPCCSGPMGQVLRGGPAATSRAAAAQRECCGGGQGQGMRGQGMRGNAADMQVARALVFSHKSIRSQVRQLPNGVETITTSTDPKVVGKLTEHVPAMYARLKEGRLIRGFDPLFRALFENGDKIDAVVTPLPNGVKVAETSKDPYVVKLIKAHAASVDVLVKEGMAAMHRTTPAPPRDGAPAR